MVSSIGALLRETDGSSTVRRERLTGAVGNEELMVRRLT